MDVNDFLQKTSAIHGARLNPEAFVDSNDAFVTRAHAFGIIEGYGDGTFRPEADITRQEAAKMLFNVSGVFGNGAPENETPHYADSVAAWASDAVEAMYAWDVMRGVAGGLFDPHGQYTAEQSIIIFMRLYENAPVSRSRSNVTHFMTFDEALEEILTATFFRVQERFDLENFTVIYGALAGVPHGPYSSLWIVYKNGGRQEIFRRLPQNPGGWQNDLDIGDVKLNADETALTFTRMYKGEKHYYSVDLASARLSEMHAEAQNLL